MQKKTDHIQIRPKNLGEIVKGETGINPIDSSLTTIDV